MSTFQITQGLAGNDFATLSTDPGARGGKADEFARLAVQEMEVGDFREAEILLQKGLETDPTHLRCRAYIGVCMAALGRDDGAAQAMVRGIVTEHPEEPGGWYALAQVHLLHGNRGVAFKHFAKARELARRDPKFRAQVDRQDPRNPNVIRSLLRDHLLNVFCGWVRSLCRACGRRTD
ncbi:MAG: tetratricopeptide repeat protein [bacterium]|nr:tetratricopeptide repeat protein [bacterium]